MSTTRSRSQAAAHPRRHRGGARGQILVIFAGGLIGLLAVAALVFDVGQNLFDWRAQRNAADAAALAGSRFIADPTCVANPSILNCPDAYQAAMQVANLNGYGDLDGDGVDDRGSVTINIPPQPPTDPIYRQAGFLQVNIHTERPSFFAAVLGILQMNVDAMAVAGNSNNVAPPYSMLALSPHDCKAGMVNGNGDLSVGGPITVISDCENALAVGGNGAISAPECNVTGGEQVSGSNAVLDCTVSHPDAIGDPLANIGPGAMPGAPAPVEIISWNSGGIPTIPKGCPGSFSDITYVGRNVAAGDTVLLPAYASGDLAVVFAYRSGADPSADTPPENPAPYDPDNPNPAAWHDAAADDDAADFNSRRIAYKILVGDEVDIGTWSNATAVAVLILRGADHEAELGHTIGAVASSGALGSTMTTPALSGMGTTGKSWVVAFGGATGGADLATLTGTNVVLRSMATVSVAIHTASNKTAWASQVYGGTPVTGPNLTDAIEIRPNPVPSTAVNPEGCTLQGPGGKDKPYTIYRIHPGVYYGGIEIKGRVRVLMAPGTYWIAGGGIRINSSNAQLVSVDGAASTTPGRGVFIYNTEDEYYQAECLAGTATIGSPCIGDIHLNGTSSNDCPDPMQPGLTSPFAPNPPTQPCQWVHLEPTDSPIANLLIFVDRTLEANIIANGGAGMLEMSGTIYNPNGDVAISGGADDAVSAQIIAYTFSITGNGGFTITYDADGVIQLSGVGLVQ